jgi:uracil-DNA glycosylase
VSDNPRWSRLNRSIIACQRCPRLIEHCRKVAHEKRASFRDWDYWGRPVPNLGDAGGRLLIVGLAPAAHGANRTGRMFTGDRSGDFLYRAMHRAGFASQPTSTRRDDGLTLIDCAVTAAAHCAPPGNKPTNDELANCAGWLEETFDAMRDLRVVLCLGGVAMKAVLKLYRERGWIDTLSVCKFGHGAEFEVAGEKKGKGERKGSAKPQAAGRRPPLILCSYHPSQQNTFTGRLTDAMLLGVFRRARKIIARQT